MIIAVTCQDNEVFQHFGHTPAFAVFTAENNTITDEKILECGDSGHGALASLLAAEKVDVLICGGIGGGAINALKAANIKVIGGASGNVREAAEKYLTGSLKVRLNFFCNHHHDHGEGHTCGDHGCGSDKCSH